MGGLSVAHPAHPRVCTGCAACAPRHCTPTTPIGGVGVCCAALALAHPKIRRVCNMSARPPRPIFVVCLRAEPGVAPYRALKGALKVLKRRFGLKATNIKLQQKEKTNDRTLRKCDQ